MPEFFTADRDGHILTITLNRPERMNALHSPAHFELDKIFNEFENDPDLWVGILTGAGERAFSAGNDLRWQAEGGSRDKPRSGFGGITERFDRTKPLIAAVNGVAMGGGFELALACDVIIAAENALFALPEPKVGLAALAGGLHRLPRMIPLKRAMGMILTARHVPAAEGYELGFVTQLVAEGEAVSAAKDFANQILECSPVSIRTSLDVVKRGLEYSDIQDAMLMQYESVKILWNSEDMIEGPLAFSEKRNPNWKGR
ncbi:MAG: enoyl-CoA hydratase [Rhodospirillaceae bacterium]|nr:enoyl-CoA hydratase [Rhodospirillaceae bacterium]|tara:strand:- start:6 stop:779 length:774 start_codon:yes stop_codon:yes gene_type:complete